jgi:hypothetical protein
MCCVSSYKKNKDISLLRFSKELKTTYRRTIGFVASSLYFSFANQYLLGRGFPFSIVMVPRYKLSLCHTPIKLDLLGFPGIDVFACGLRDHVITRFTSITVIILMFYGNSHNSQFDRWIEMIFYVESPDILSYIGLKFHLNSTFRSDFLVYLGLLKSNKSDPIIFRILNLDFDVKYAAIQFYGVPVSISAGA